MFREKRKKKNIMWKKRKAEAKGPSFLNQKTVEDLW
jgi:hypothetical protein